MVSRGNRACKDMRVESGLCLTCPPAQPRGPHHTPGLRSQCSFHCPAQGAARMQTGLFMPWEEAMALMLPSQVASSP